MPGESPELLEERHCFLKNRSPLVVSRAQCQREDRYDHRTRSSTAKTSKMKNHPRAWTYELEMPPGLHRDTTKPSARLFCLPLTRGPPTSPAPLFSRWALVRVSTYPHYPAFTRGTRAQVSGNAACSLLDVRRSTCELFIIINHLALKWRATHVEELFSQNCKYYISII